MAIDPTKASGAQSPLTGARLDQASGNQAARQSGQARPAVTERDSAAADDQVQLSEQARAARPAPGTSPSGLSADRMQEILKRVTSGYYDSPQVVEKVARKVADALGGSTPA
ncbi:MAG: hypothetical protein IPI38_13600 [Gemmatimonadetes bacterium]|nr:hypothetical protein [Gemmatimonadota bacterium]MBP6669153.1 hypothetical protein [Gemmatimonadales bacterium]MBK6778263.1 hypothetical protein [Gemmatimonadota bacterium]MBK7349427.1 hypothetical protein [Gemmatimonadota bacterium]MBK7716439.1 hypothetical protein [Gemmatimonadota bacterium]